MKSKDIITENYDMEDDEYMKAELSDTRRPRLTIRHLNIISICLISFSSSLEIRILILSKDHLLEICIKMIFNINLKRVGAINNSSAHIHLEY